MSGISKYQLVKSPAAFIDLIDVLHQRQIFSFDTETTGLDLFDDEIVGISLSVGREEAYYVPLDPAHLTDGLSVGFILNRLKPIFQSPHKLKVAHNLKFEFQVLAKIGVEVSLPYFDTLIASGLIEPDKRSHSLDVVASTWLGEGKRSFREMAGTGAGGIDIKRIDIDDLTQYACRDADLCFRLYEVLYPVLQENGLIRVLNEVELPLISILADMERSGAYVETWALKEVSDRLEERIECYELRIKQMTGREFNIQSPKQLSKVLYEVIRIQDLFSGHKKPRRTKTGYSTNDDTLAMYEAHPLVNLIRQHRQMIKLKTSYCDVLPGLVHPITDRLHTRFLQLGTATGRLSSSHPNLQNIPLHSPAGEEVRRAFRVQDNDHILLAADYSQIELRLLASFADEPGLLGAFQSGVDVHSETAAGIFGVPRSNVTKRMRQQAKAVNFGIAYGMTAFQLGRTTGMPIKSAKQFIDRYFARYPAIQKYMEDKVATARQLGYAASIMGRRRPLDHLDLSKRKDANLFRRRAINTPIQASASDLIKLAMINTAQRLKCDGFATRLIIQVHDELVFEVPMQELREVQAVILREMSGALELSVPLLAEYGVGTTWLETQLSKHQAQSLISA